MSTRALLLRRVSTGETDLVLTMFTEEQGRVSLLARAARRSSKRFGGALEPMHTLRIRYDEHTGSELGILREASLDQPRTGLVARLDRLEAGGRGLSWLRHAVVPRTPEPQAWRRVMEFLDALAAGKPPDLELAEFGLALLTALGFGLELGRCVGCGKPCESGRSAMIDARRGGLVCSACGGAQLRLRGAQRARMELSSAGRGGVLEPADAPVALSLVEAALAAHLGFERTP